MFPILLISFSFPSLFLNADATQRANISQAKSTEMEDSSVASLHTTKYAAAKRSGSHLQMEIRQVRHSVQGERTSRVQIDGDSVSVSSALSSFYSRSASIVEKYFGTELESDAFPSQAVNGWTLRFKDGALEREYRVHASMASIPSAMYISFFCFLYGAFRFVTSSQSPPIWGMVYGLIASVNAINFIVFAIIKRWIRKADYKEKSSRVYYVMHGFAYLAIVMLFLSKSLGVPDINHTEAEIVVLAITIVISGDFRASLIITLLANIYVITVVMFGTKFDFMIVYRCVSPFFVTSVISISLSRMIESQRKKSFFSKKKMKWAEETISNMKDRTRFFLSNIYPIPVMNCIVGQGGIASYYRAPNSSVICVQMLMNDISNESSLVKRELDFACRQIIQVATDYHIHKVKSTGLCLTFVSGLFGESVANLLDVGGDIQSKFSQYKLNHVSIKVGIGSGYLEGGIVEFSKSAFEIIGQAYEEAMDSLSCTDSFEIITDTDTKEMWIQNFNQEESLSHFEKVFMTKNKRVTTRWIFQRNNPPTAAYHTPIHQSAAAERYKNNPNPESHSLQDKTDVMAISRKQNGFRAYLGFLRFDSTNEIKYQNSIKTLENKDITTVQSVVIAFFFVIFGFIDFNLLEENCPSFKVRAVPIFFIRYFVLAPLLFILVMAYYLVDIFEGRFERANYQNIPLFIGTLYGIFSLSSSAFLFSEVYEVGIYFASVISIEAHHALASFFIWIGYSTALFARYQEKMGAAEVGLITTIITWFFVPFFFFYIFTLSREFSSRADFLDNEKLEESIKNLANEHEINERALMSALQESTLQNLRKSKMDSMHSGEDTGVIVMEISSHAQADDTDDASSVFKLLSGVIRLVEKIALSYSLLIIKSTGSTIVVLSQKYEKMEAKDEQQEHIELAIRFSQHVIQEFAALKLSQSRLNFFGLKMCIDSGNVSYGLIGDKDFVSDCYGETVTRLMHLSRNIYSEEIVVSQKIYDMFRDHSCFNLEIREAVYCDKELRTLYRVSERMDVLETFVKSISWMSDQDQIQRGHAKRVSNEGYAQQPIEIQLLGQDIEEIL